MEWEQGRRDLGEGEERGRCRSTSTASAAFAGETKGVQVLLAYLDLSYQVFPATRRLHYAVYLQALGNIGMKVLRSFTPLLKRRENERLGEAVMANSHINTVQ